MVWNYTTNIRYSIFTYISRSISSCAYYLALHLKDNIIRFFYFYKYLLKSIVSNQECLSTPCIHPNSWHYKNIRYYFKERLRDNNINNCCEVGTRDFTDRVLFLQLDLIFFLNKNSKLVLSIYLLFLCLKTNKAHIKINTVFRFENLINIFEGTYNWRLFLRTKFILPFILDLIRLIMAFFKLFYFCLNFNHFIW